MILELTPQQRVRGNGRILDLLGEDSWRNVLCGVFSDDGGHFYAGGGFKVVIGR
jgi:hypothetical protein